MNCPICGELDPIPGHVCPVWEFLGPNYIPDKKPYTCPVCNGKGEVGCGFYTGASIGTANEKCRSCNGTGILWG